MAHSDWRKLERYLHTRYLTGSLTESAALASAIAAAVTPTDVRLTDAFVDVRIETEDAAQVVSEIAADLGHRAEPTAVMQVELGLDTADRAEIGPFWAAVLTGDPAVYEESDVTDPTGRFDNLWFQKTEDARETPRQRFHLDVWVPAEVVESRIAAAVAAGGTVVSTDEAPAFIVLADPQGNKACLCTSVGR